MAWLLMDLGPSLQAELSAIFTSEWQPNRAFCWYMQGHALAGGVRSDRLTWQGKLWYVIW